MQGQINKYRNLDRWRCDTSQGQKSSDEFVYIAAQLAVNPLDELLSSNV